MNRSSALLLFLALTILPAFAAEAATPIGVVSRLQGDGTGAMAGQTTALAAGAAVYLDERIATGAEARLELTFDDGTVLTVGEKAALTLDTYLYRPGSAGNRLRLSVSGPFRFVSGKLSKGPESDVSVRTPVATIGIRGTDFWGGPIDGRFGVFLIAGSVTVSNAAGQALLGRAGEGVNLDVGGAPGPVTLWPTDKVGRAIATVTFR
jgi:hypothetical protein